VDKNINRKEQSSPTNTHTKKPVKKLRTGTIARSLECYLDLSIGSDEVKLSLAFESVKESENGNPLHEQPNKRLIYTILTEPRKNFTDEEQINIWASELHRVFTTDLTGSLINTILSELKAAARVRLNMVGVQGHSNKQILDEQLHAYKEHLQRALVLPGARNKSPLNKERLTLVLQHALHSIPKKELAKRNLSGLYLEVHLYVLEHPEHYPTDIFPPTSDALRKLCDKEGVNLEQLADSVRNGEI